MPFTTAAIAAAAITAAPIIAANYVIRVLVEDTRMTFYSLVIAELKEQIKALKRLSKHYNIVS